MENETKAGATNEVKENVPGTGTDAGQVTPPAVTEKSDNTADDGVNGAENEGTKTPQTKQDSATNKEFARRRREQEKEKLRKEERLKTVKELVGNNPWTGEAIETESDVEMYLRMKKIEQNGGDPLNDYAKTLAAEEREIQANKNKGALRVNFENLSDEQKSDVVASDFASFKEKHPEVNVDELFENKGFLEFAGEHLGEVPLSVLYSMYNKATEKKVQQANELEEKAMQKAKNDASVGALGTPGAASDAEFFTKEQVKNMSAEEIRKNYEKIRRSQEKW